VKNRGFLVEKYTTIRRKQKYTPYFSSRVRDFDMRTFPLPAGLELVEFMAIPIRQD
jgi:hypothetical protein